MSQLVIKSLNQILDDPDTDYASHEAEYRRGYRDGYAAIINSLFDLPVNVVKVDSDLLTKLFTHWQKPLERWQNSSLNQGLEPPAINWNREWSEIFSRNEEEVTQLRPARQYRTDDPGFIYVIRSRGSGFCKIGKTGDVSKRLRSLETMNGDRLETVITAKVAACSMSEAALHDRFASKRKHGEWFELTNADIGFIADYLAKVRVS